MNMSISVVVFYPIVYQSFRASQTADKLCCWINLNVKYKAMPHLICALSTSDIYSHCLDLRLDDPMKSILMN
jgi:hypothetical protein